MMNILHTSDWHIGREFENESLATEQRAFLSWVAEQVATHSVDLVIVAGDIYDKAMPKGDAVELLDEGLDLIRGRGAQILLISGNHDNAQRLGFGAKRQRESGVHIYAQDEAYPVPFVFSVRDESCVITAIPFLDPQRAPQPVDNETGEPIRRTHQSVLEDAIAHASALRVGEPNLPSICVAHAYVQGSEISESERHSVGNADLVDAAIFDGFTYTALGHLHRPQTIPGHDRVAYSGSPLPYSFSEEHAKSVRLLELTADGTLEVTTLPIPMGRPVKVLTDTFDNLMSNSSYDAFVDHWISVKLVETGVIEGPMARLRKRFPHIASLAYADVRRSGASGPREGVDYLKATDPFDVIMDYVSDLQGREPADYEVALAHRGLDVVKKAESE